MSTTTAGRQCSDARSGALAIETRIAKPAIRERVPAAHPWPILAGSSSVFHLNQVWTFASGEPNAHHRDSVYGSP